MPPDDPASSPPGAPPGNSPVFATSATSAPATSAPAPALDTRASTDERPRLGVVVGSTRPGRVGRPVADWAVERAEAHGAFQVELFDLAAVALPLLDEPGHPRLGDYHHDHTRTWSAMVDRADAFVFVTPEYNHSFPAALKNAIDYLHAEWRDKPVGFVSYGGVAGGTRAVSALKPVVATLKMVPVPEGVIVPFVHKMIDDGRFEPGEVQERNVTAMLDELARMAALLRPGR